MMVMRSFNFSLVGLFLFASVLLSFGIVSADACDSYTTADDCWLLNDTCEWEFNFSNEYECREDMLVDYCSPFVSDFAGCVGVNAPDLFGCYWDMELVSEFEPFKLDCMPVDGNCSDRETAVCENFVGCVNSSSGCIGQNELLGSCKNVLVNSTCDVLDDCVWDVEMGICVVDCDQYDATDGGNSSECFGAFNGGLCMWDPSETGYCNPFGVNPMGGDECFACHEGCGEVLACHTACDTDSCLGGGENFSSCFMNDGNATGCKADLECAWMPVEFCFEGDYCYDILEIEHGYCNPGFMDFSMDVDCIQYDGDQNGCTNAINFGDSCEWSSDPWGPLLAGTESGWCNNMLGGSSGCWDNFNEDACNASADMGMPCEWKSDNYGGWCEQKGCWTYDGDNASCMNSTLTVLNCSYDTTNNFCYENFGSGCGSSDGSEFDCYNTGFCFWNQSDSTCNDPSGFFTPKEFSNPGCWLFNNSNGGNDCSNTTSCNWTGSTCDDLTANANNGIQCVDINNSEMCGSIPMLSTCCTWNGTGCESAPQINTCWDNKQEPPVGAMFCEDYNAIKNETNCDLIASSPWYMPCEFNASGNEECHFAFNDMFGGGGIGLGDIGSESNCEAAGGIWKSEKWEDSGIVYSDEWCEMGFGFGFETCDSSCWACEFDETGEDWDNDTAAEIACNSSLAFNSSCVFYNDTNAFNDFGWCDINHSSFNDKMGIVENWSAFVFEDCMGIFDSDGDGLAPSEDPDCFGFLKNGFIKMEKGTECGDDIDNDGNGLEDCADPGCMYDSFYCADFIPVNDTTSPTITWFDVHTYPQGAFIGIDTNEPTNATVWFYKEDYSCIVKNSTILDGKLNNTFTLDDYDVWHDIIVDDYSLGYSLSSNTTYSYKTYLCDNGGNCITSACTNFTTDETEEDFIVGFDLPDPTGVPTDYLGLINVGFDLDGDGNFSDAIIDSQNGLKFNVSKGKDIDIKFSNPNATGDWGIYFMGADLLKVLNMDITDAFIVNDTADGDVMLGMKKDSWNEFAQSLGVDYVRIVMPQDLSVPANAIIKHCPDDAADGDDSGCVELDPEDDIDCTFGSSSTVCEIPVNVGFSVFVVEDAYIAPAEEASSSGGSGGSSTGVPALTQAGISRTYMVGGRYQFSHDDNMHSVEVSGIVGGKANITIASTPTSYLLGVGESAQKDLDDDGDYDVLIEVTAVTETSVTFDIKAVEDTEVADGVTSSAVEDVNSGSDETGSGVDGEAVATPSNKLLYLGVFLLIVGGVVWFGINKKKNSKKK